MFTSSPRASPRVTIVAFVDHSDSSASTSATSAEPPSRSVASKAFSRPMMIPGSPTYPTSTIEESCSTGRSATSSPSATFTSVTSIVTPAPSRAVRPAPISNPSRPPPNSAYE